MLLGASEKVLHLCEISSHHMSGEPVESIC